MGINSTERKSWTVYNYGGPRDYTKYQIYFVESPSVNSDIAIVCYHCDEPIIKERDQKYIIVAGAQQRPLYFHTPDCYAAFLEGMVIFYKEVLCKENPDEMELGGAT